MKPERATIDDYEFLRAASEAELQVALLAFLPVIRIEEKPTADKCKFMIGTQSAVLMIKANKVITRVGGGFAALEDYIR